MIHIHVDIYKVKSKLQPHNETLTLTKVVFSLCHVLWFYDNSHKLFWAFLTKLIFSLLGRANLMQMEEITWTVCTYISSTHLNCFVLVTTSTNCGLNKFGFGGDVPLLPPTMGYNWLPWELTNTKLLANPGRTFPSSHSRCCSHIGAWTDSILSTSWHFVLSNCSTCSKSSIASTWVTWFLGVCTPVQSLLLGSHMSLYRNKWPSACSLQI